MNDKEVSETFALLEETDPEYFSLNRIKPDLERLSGELDKLEEIIQSRIYQ